MGRPMAGGFADAAFAGKHTGIQATAHERDVFVADVRQYFSGGGAQVSAIDDQSDAAEGIGTERRMGQPSVRATLARFLTFGQSGEVGIDVEKTGSRQQDSGHGEKGKVANSDRFGSIAGTSNGRYQARCAERAG